ncbi:sirohydrochlorin chelatase [Paenibacillus guangzhouensis]|uniref:sirohydrochlorin chelatase n=1 Tax=Paenibacillus guangzhouensis TaxID=1473112 RepID=UPI0012674078|nr:CbiX/SirB N-terminal domain-containing protein [Paenibacillus guangzhouensis]
MRPGILIIGHGSRDRDWVALVDEAVRHAELPEGIPAEVVFLEIVEGRLIQDGIDRLEAKGVTDLFVIPFFVSGGSTHVDEIAYALGVKDAPSTDTDLLPFRVQARVWFGEPMDEDPIEMAEIAMERSRALLGGRKPEETVLMLVAHGSEHPLFYDRYVGGLLRVADRIQREMKYAAIDSALLLPEQLYDKIIRWQTETDYTVMVVPLFLSSGYFTNRVIPNRIGQAVCVYDGQALLPHPLVSSWLSRQVRQVMQRR